VKSWSKARCKSAAPVETLETRGFPPELGKVSMNNAPLSHTLHGAEGGHFNQTPY